MTYVTVRCRCCKGKWRLRFEEIRARVIVHILGVDAICSRCNQGECSRPDTDLAAHDGCNEGRKR